MNFDFDWGFRVCLSKWKIPKYWIYYNCSGTRPPKMLKCYQPEDSLTIWVYFTKWLRKTFIRQLSIIIQGTVLFYSSKNWRCCLFRGSKSPLTYICLYKNICSRLSIVGNSVRIANSKSGVVCVCVDLFVTENPSTSIGWYDTVHPYTTVRLYAARMIKHHKQILLTSLLDSKFYSELNLIKST